MELTIKPFDNSFEKQWDSFIETEHFYNQENFLIIIQKNDLKTIL